MKSFSVQTVQNLIMRGGENSCTHYLTAGVAVCTRPAPEEAVTALSWTGQKLVSFYPQVKGAGETDSRKGMDATFLWQCGP